MSVLNDSDLAEWALTNLSGIDPEVEPCSIDVHLGDEIGFYLPTKHAIDPYNKDTYPRYETFEIDQFTAIRAKDFWLATTAETVDIPNDMIGLVHGKSSIGRLGLFVHNAGLIDSGFRGQITLELFNASKNDILLHAGMEIAQITLLELTDEAEQPYSSANGNRYNGQTGPTPSRYYE